ncbi:MAG: hypothetical protein BAJATHORv1_10235 [Candidatus Thorarchaeota archaeon]|nr:MAG: hypothetical protein BAJATHORv1_10235 [Candidatus Thorarchaeota archaeon]
MSIRPDYEKQSLVNLSSAIASYIGNQSSYPELVIGDQSITDTHSSLLLLVIDGLGYNCLRRQIHSGPLRDNLTARLTSVFPPSTGPVISSLFTATPPAQHGITGWYVYLKELGVVTQFLPFVTMANNHPMDIKISDFIGSSSILRAPRVKSVTVQPEDIVDSKYSSYMSGHSHREGYEGLGDLIDSLSFELSRKGKKFVYAYYGELDHLSHKFGCEHEKTLNHLELIDEKIGNFLEHNLPRDVRVIITADHGMVDATRDTLILGEDHPALTDTLTMPVCGDTRTGYCYVRPSRVDNFLNYIDDNLSHACYVRESSELVDEGWFGYKTPSPTFEGRIGDYVLMMKENYAYLNHFPGRNRKIILGHHGGVSEEEMYVPLIVFER